MGKGLARKRKDSLGERIFHSFFFHPQPILSPAIQAPYALLLRISAFRQTKFQFVSITGPMTRWCLTNASLAFVLSLKATFADKLCKQISKVFLARSALA